VAKDNIVAIGSFISLLFCIGSVLNLIFTAILWRDDHSSMAGFTPFEYPWFLTTIYLIMAVIFSFILYEESG